MDLRTYAHWDIVALTVVNPKVLPGINGVINRGFICLSPTVIDRCHTGRYV